MANRVEPFTSAFKAETGADVELFNAAYQSGFTIEGRYYNWKEIVDDWNEMMKREYPNQSWVPYNDPNALTNIRSTLMYKADALWMRKLNTEGYTIRDIGKTYDSHFYDMGISFY